jgi:sugar phosphate isomerase/epimerase
MNKTGLAFYTISGTVSKPEDYPGAFKKIRALGYHYVEAGLPLPLPAEEYARMVKDAGLLISDMHVPIPMLKDDLKTALKELKTLNCAYATIPHPGQFPLNTVDDWKKLAALATEAGKELAKEGIKLQYHNHHLEFQKFDGKAGLEILYAESDPLYLKAQLDTHWVARGGASPVAWLLKMKGRTEQVHFKDTGIRNKTEPIFAPVGEGNLDWAGILKACRECGIEYYIMELDPNDYTPDPYGAAEAGFKNMKNWGLAG